MITYEPLTQLSHMPNQLNHTKAYRDICNRGTLITFQPLVHWFHFNQSNYI